MQDFPSFDDFLSEMGVGTAVGWIEEAVDKCEIALVPPFTPENMQQYAAAVIATSQAAAFAMMRQYHQWLVEQLRRRSIRLV